MFGSLFANDSQTIEVVNITQIYYDINMNLIYNDLINNKQYYSKFP